MRPDDLNVFYQGQPGAAEATLYMSDGNVVVTELLICNTTAAAAAVSLSFVPRGGTAGVANRVVAGLPIPANDTVVLTIATPLGPAAFISGLQTVTGACTVTISGERG